jgi:hypothetical protein
MKYPMIFFAAASLAAQEAPPATPAPAISSGISGNKSILVIEPKSRANDWVQAFDLLRRDKPTLKIMIRTYSGMTLANVTDLTVAHGGTLFIVRVLSNQGSKYQILPVEEIVEVAYSPT